MTAAYKETDVTIHIRSDRYYSAEYRIAINPTIRPRSEYEANIRYSPNICNIYIYIICIYVYNIYIYNINTSTIDEIQISWVNFPFLGFQ